MPAVERLRRPGDNPFALPFSHASMKFDLPEEADLVVVGAGAGGMTAALAGALHGLDVVLCEATQQVGGTTAASAGTIWVPCSTPARAAGYADSVEEAMQYLDALVPSGEGRRLREVYLRSGPAIVDALMQRTQVQFMATGRHPDYRDQPGSKTAGRPLSTVPFDGRRLGADFERIRAPMNAFTVLGGMMVAKTDIAPLLRPLRSWAHFRHAAALLLRHAADRARFRRGTRLVMGNALVARLYASLKDARVPVVFGARLADLVVEDGRVTGVRLLREDGETATVRARKGVVLAAGGIGHHPELRKRVLRSGQDRWPSTVFAGNEGSAVAAAVDVGATITKAPGGPGVFYQPVSMPPDRDGSTRLFPHLFLDRAKPGFIAVDRRGRRFTSEGESYHDFCEAQIRRDAEVPAIPAWAICDADFIRKYGLGLIHPGTTRLARYTRSGYLVCADTIEELARKIGVDADGLAETVARNNQYAASGVDAEFGKGTSALSRFNGDPEHGPNPCLGPIARAPFCAMALSPADAAADAGLATDEDARVLDAAGTPLPGLYACGGDMASIMCGSYPGPGTAIGPAMVFGWRAAVHAARQR
jgi:succinate dehydrogenase/fumarate reductase flavoprotein subunit